MGKQRWHGDTCVVYSSINHDDLICPALGCLKFGRLPVLEWLVPVSGCVRVLVFALLNLKVDQLLLAQNTTSQSLNPDVRKVSPQ